MNANNSYLNLKINKLDFKITKAVIKESLDQIFLCECEGFYENINNDIFSDDNIEFDPNMLIDKEASLIIKNPYENKKIDFSTNIDMIYKGIISYVEYLGVNQGSVSNIVKENFKQLNHKHFFKFNLHSPLIRLDFNKANRIYTHTNIIEAIKQTLAYYNTKLNKNIDFSNIHHIYETKELISQYNESDLEFITRLAHNHGIYFYEDKDNIYFYDFYTHKGKTKDIVFNPNINNHLNEACIYALNKEKQIQTNAFTHSSNNSKQPLSLYSLSTKAQNTNTHYNEHYYESEYSFTQNINLKQSPTLKEKRNSMLNNTLKAKSNIYHLSLNESIKINIQKETTKEYTIIAKEQILIDDAILANTINTNDNLNIKDLNLSKSYTNNLTLIPSFLTFTPSFKSKPKPPINTMGMVIGEDSNIENQRNTIYTDEYGRVKVRINLYANQEELDNKTNMYHHSPFLRVASSVASNHSGFYHTPRIGDEVIISFLDDDIDKPFISGSLYNGVNTMPQYNYPRYKREIAEQTLNYLNAIPMYNKGLDELKLQENTEYNLNYKNEHYLTISNSTIGKDNTDAKARNEITLKNDIDKEEFYILAQKDYKEEIGNNYEQTIKNNKTSEVGALYTEFITLGHMQNIIGFKNVNVGAKYLENTLLSKDTNVGLSNTLNVGTDQEVKIHKNSYEKVGENKKVEIGRNYEERITGEYTSSVSSNRKTFIRGYHHIESQGKYSVHTDSELVTEAKGNIQEHTEKSIFMVAKKDHCVNAENVSSLAQKDNTIVAHNRIINQVKSTSITTTAKEVIIQVGGVQVIIDDKGLRVKGGDLRAD
ncbi:type VI secretion system, secreted protein [Campylobacter lari RM16712]|uniref:type VI secretion system Vgr family protein n=1 Tax=Campylobacter lari TaxID=201 RepID=UPI00057FF63B|nr:type VI secretion system tip protein VgrG [Campylobacter lari]AJD06365.1 type VI secretion system, secreted protein [Campylobacter lari RM16712]